MNDDQKWWDTPYMRTDRDGEKHSPTSRRWEMSAINRIRQFFLRFRYVEVTDPLKVIALHRVSNPYCHYHVKRVWMRADKLALLRP
jgi:hypothetical protein